MGKERDGMQGRTQDISAKLKQDWKGAVIANWKLWIPFQFINFRFVPQQLQVSFNYHCSASYLPPRSLMESLSCCRC